MVYHRCSGLMTLHHDIGSLTWRCIISESNCPVGTAATAKLGNCSPQQHGADLRPRACAWTTQRCHQHDARCHRHRHGGLPPRHRLARLPSCRRALEQPLERKRRGRHEVAGHGGSCSAVDTPVPSSWSAASGGDAAAAASSSSLRASSSSESPSTSRFCFCLTSPSWRRTASSSLTL
jgi:hypothetical protein